MVKGNFEGMKDKIDQLMRAINNMMAREAEVDKRNVASISTPPSVDDTPCNDSSLTSKGLKQISLHQKLIPFILKGLSRILFRMGASRPVQIPVP